MTRLSTSRVCLLVAASLVFLHYTTSVFAPFTQSLSFSRITTKTTKKVSTCSPRDWADGHWEHRPRPRVPGVNDTAMEHREDVFKYNGLRGCASDREFHWHLRSDNEALFDRFPAVTEYVWVPSPRCTGVEPLSPEGLIKHLVEEGSWLVLGGWSSSIHLASFSTLAVSCAKKGSCAKPRLYRCLDRRALDVTRSKRVVL